MSTSHVCVCVRVADGNLCTRKPADERKSRVADQEAESREADKIDRLTWNWTVADGLSRLSGSKGSFATLAFTMPCLAMRPKVSVPADDDARCLTHPMCDHTAQTSAMSSVLWGEGGGLNRRTGAS